MADFDDQLLASAFADFRNEVAPFVKPAGTAAARETVRVRRRTRTIAATTLAALVIAGPVAAYAAVNGDSHGPPLPGTSITPTASPSSSSSPSAAAPSTSAPPAPDGRITKTDLGKSTLDLPAWAPDAYVKGCVSGPVKFTNGAHPIADSQAIYVDKVVYTDVDQDGAQETVASLSCGDQGSTFQVVAFDRDSAGAIRTIGQVAVQTGAVKAICDIRVGSAPGTVDVRVGDFSTPLRCLEPPAAYIQFQWRTYAWNGSAFTQTAGPTTFPTNPKVTDFAVTSTDLVFGAPVGGVYHGSMTVTVRNTGRSKLPYTVMVQVPSGVNVVTSGCTIETFPQPVVNVSCAQPALAAGSSKQVKLEFTATAPVTPDFIPGASAMLADTNGDPNMDNNRATFAVKF